ncbi:MAG: hypothetical protein WDZ84_16005 [Rhodovibrionaceae bacterium]
MAGKKKAVISGSDGKFADFAEDLLRSIRKYDTLDFDLCFICMGTDPKIREIAESHCDKVFVYDDPKPPKNGNIISANELKPLLPQIFPGYDDYMWVDADVWVQNPIGFNQVFAAAQRADLAIHPELDPHYYMQTSPSDRTRTVYRRLFSPELAEKTIRFPMINTGVIAARAASPIWGKWEKILKQAFAGELGGKQDFSSDQIPLHHLVFSGELSMSPLRAINNWQCHCCLPAFLVAKQRLVVPSPPYEEINFLHLTGELKTLEITLTGALSGKTLLRFRDIEKVWREHAKQGAASRG